MIEVSIFSMDGYSDAFDHQTINRMYIIRVIDTSERIKNLTELIFSSPYLEFK
jgi:hypothetical protein